MGDREGEQKVSAVQENWFKAQPTTSPNQVCVFKTSETTKLLSLTSCQRLESGDCEQGFETPTLPSGGGPEYVLATLKDYDQSCASSQMQSNGSFSTLGFYLLCVWAASRKR